jgi:hypothetical protein
MIQIAPQMRILVAVEPVDFRSGIDGLCRICRQRLKEDPFSGCVFVFCNLRSTAIKVFVYDSQGFWVCHKRLSEGKFVWWPKGRVQDIEHRLLFFRLQSTRRRRFPAALRSLHFAPGSPPIQAGPRNHEGFTGTAGAYFKGERFCGIHQSFPLCTWVSSVMPNI